MIKIDYFTEWMVYKTADAADDDYCQAVDTRQQAIVWMRDNYPVGKVRCCCSIDAQLSGNEFGYGDTKAEALRNLKAQVKEYGYLPYDPYKE